MTSPAQHVMKLGLGFAVSQSLRLIIELGIPDLLANGARHVSDLAAATGSDAEALHRVMRLLTSEGVFSETAPRCFVLTEVGAMLRSDRPGPRDFIRMINGEAYLAFERLAHSVDLYVIKKVIHDRDDERATTILRNCRKTVSPNGRVLVAETLVPEGDEPDQIKTIDIVMLAVTGGLERTQEQYASLFKAAGLRLERVLHTKAPIAMIEAVAR